VTAWTDESSCGRSCHRLERRHGFAAAWAGFFTRYGLGPCGGVQRPELGEGAVAWRLRDPLCRRLGVDPVYLLKRPDIGER
jgi:hypothetical protein